MAKQRPQPKSKVPAASASGTERSDQSASLPKRSLPPSSFHSQPQHRRTTYFEAVALYEKGLAALQRHDYPAAIELLQSVLQQYPEEKELHERVRLYLNVCRRHVSPTEASPQTVQERLYASTLALNGGRYDEAISHLRLVRDEDPDNDHALYMLAVAHAQRGEHAEALAHLQRSIALNSENRALARRDPDLDPLRADETFRAAVNGGPAFQYNADRRRPLKPRSGR